MVTNLRLAASVANLKLLVVRALCPSLKKKRPIWYHTFLRRESGEEREKTPLVCSCLRCPSSIAGLWVTFSFPFLLKLISWASNIWFDRINLGSLANWSPLLYGGAFRYLSMACLNPSLIMFTPTTVCAPRRKSLLRAGLQGFRSEIGYQIFYQGLK